LIVTAEGTTTEREFTIDNKNIAVGKEKSVMEPFFAYKDGILKVSYLNFPEEAMSINFYDKNDLLYKKELGKKFNVNEGFDLSKLAKGSYDVVLSTEDNSYSFNFEVK
jgi:hypothetical protein